MSDELLTPEQSADLAALLESGLWEKHEGGQGDPCDVCGEEMPVNPLTAVFGAHRKCSLAVSASCIEVTPQP